MIAVVAFDLLLLGLALWQLRVVRRSLKADRDGDDRDRSG